MPSRIWQLINNIKDKIMIDITQRKTRNINGVETYQMAFRVSAALYEKLQIAIVGTTLQRFTLDAIMEKIERDKQC